MRGARTSYILCASAIALAWATGGSAQEGVSTSAPADARASRKPDPKALAFNVPLVSARRAYGDVLIEVSGTRDIAIDTQGLRRELSPTLNDVGRAALDGIIAGRSTISPLELQEAGFNLVFDDRQLELRVDGIRPDYLAVQKFGQERAPGGGVDLPVIEPAHFSTYLNLTGNYDYSTRGGSETPDVFYDGATRLGNVVVEYDGAATSQFGDGYKLYRRATRAVYDVPGSFQRYAAGDLQPNTLSILRAPEIAGISLEKSRQIFDPFATVSRLGGRRIFLDNRSEVEVLINGAAYQTFQLDAGTYDLANLPIEQGANDVQLLIRDSFGREQVVDYNLFFEPLILAAGEEEYSIGVGLLSEALGFAPSYTDELAFSGYYRKGISGNLVLGGALQATDATQAIAASIAVVPQVVPGVLDLELAGSRSSGRTGGSVRANYRLSTGNGFDSFSQFSINAEYQSKGFATIDNVLPIDFDLLSLNASYSRSFGRDTSATIGGFYLKTSARRQDDYTVFADVSHRLSRRMRLTAGVEYGRATDFRSAFGVRLGITVALGGRTRALADYRSRNDSFRANFARGADNDIGSIGYDLSVSKFREDTQADLQLNYNANRFEARATLGTGGLGFGGITDDQRARLQISTSLAYAEGIFGVGRPIDGAFLLARPHEKLSDNGIVTARTLDGGDYYANSGLLGAAVQGDLSAYTEQSVQYDAADPGDGFDVGDGVTTINPPYKAGYAISVGNGHFVSVIGIVEDEAGPLALATGTVHALDPDEDFSPMPFFTNRTGRYGLFGFAPGKRYEVRLRNDDRRFVIAIPEDSGAVVRNDIITIPAEE